jgi:hypothetical protein
LAAQNKAQQRSKINNTTNTGEVVSIDNYFDQV